MQDDKGRTITPTQGSTPAAHSQAGSLGVFLYIIALFTAFAAPIWGFAIFTFATVLILYANLYDRLVDTNNLTIETNRLLEQQNHISTSLALYLRDIRDRQTPPFQPDPHAPDNFPT